VAPTIEHHDALGGLGPFDLVLDVGANKGQFAAFAAAEWPTATIISFEPLAAPHAKLCRVLAMVAQGRHQVLACALGSAAGESIIHVATREDSSSLLPLGAEQKQIFGMGAASVETVTVKRLDDVVDVSETDRLLLKIDVQGFELEVLKGAQITLARTDYVFVEMSFIMLYEGQALADEVTAFLEGNGFALTGQFNEFRDDRGRLIQADALFKRTI